MRIARCDFESSSHPSFRNGDDEVDGDILFVYPISSASESI
jgi:hypothetical protein